MLCTRCKKNIAVVFVSDPNNKEKSGSLCINCAKELGLIDGEKIMNQMGITEDMLSSMTSALMENMENGDGGFSMDGIDMDGTMASFPFLENLFGGSGEVPSKDKAEKIEKKGNSSKSNEKAQDKKRKFLNSYCINLTQSAKEGKLDRIIGRDRELARLMQILNRRSKNNPCLIGEPGVGKTAIAEALAQKIIENNVPTKIQGKEVFLLDMTALVAGTQFRGQFESRMKGLVEEVKEAGNIILFVDEVHNLVGAGDAEGAMNAANILKPALSRGEVQMIGATTLVEYRKHIEKDTALERRFQPILVEEPTSDEAIEILKGIKGYYSGYHGIEITDEVVAQAVIMSERYITDRYLPDKAIDLLDEAASQVNLSDKTINGIAKLTNEIKELNSEREKVLSDDYPETDKFQKIADLKSKECVLNAQLKDMCAQPLPRLSVEDLAGVIELWTNIPASKICKAEFVKLGEIEKRIKERIVAQDEAVELVCNAIRRNRVGIGPKRKPVSMIFAGSTGVGKTELVKTLASEMFDNKDSLIRLDMSEFMEKHSVSRIIGAPPGYVGYDDAGQLTEKVRRKPYCVILFDEIEKAHPDVLNVLLQILDDGRVSDAHGKSINFENTVIIMTTNAGSNIKENSVGFNKSSSFIAKEKVMKALNDFLRPEFLNRIDEIIVFNQLNEESFISIAKIMLAELKKSLMEKQITLDYTEQALEYLSKKAFDVKYGARNLRRLIEREIENEIASIMIKEYEKTIKKMLIDTKEEKITIDYTLA